MCRFTEPDPKSELSGMTLWNEVPYGWKNIHVHLCLIILPSSMSSNDDLASGNLNNFLGDMTTSCSDRDTLIKREI